MESMKTIVIINPEAGSAGEYEQLRKLIERQEDYSCLVTSGPGEAKGMAKKALDGGADQIGIAGGDGTVNEVVNGVMEHERTVRLGVLPMGTGNDLARTLALPQDPRDALVLLQLEDEADLDVIEVERDDGSVRYGINVCAGGFSGQVDERLESGTKSQWGPLAYIFGAANVLPDLREYDIVVSYDGGPEEEVDALNVIIANGRTAAGGRSVAPKANPQDGKLDVVIVEQCRLAQLASVAARLAAGSYQESPFVQYHRVERVHVRSEPGMWFNVDGELLTKEPLSFGIVPQALTFVVGADYQAEPNAA